MRLSIAMLTLLALGSFVHAQDKEDVNQRATQILLDKAEEEYRTYFKRPETTFELWAAIKFELDVGKFDLAGLHLKRLLRNEKVKPEQVEEDLFRIEGAEGMNSFLRLLRVERWSDHPPFQKETEAAVKEFFDRVGSVVDRKLSDPERIYKFIAQLDAPTPEERNYAFVQLNRSRERAVPYLIEKLQETQGQPLHHRIIEAMVNLDAETAPAYLEVLKAQNDRDARDQELRLTLLRILRSRGDTRATPYLWHLSASKSYPPQIREAALDMLAEFLKVDKKVLPPAKLALVEMSEDYFRHKVAFPSRIRFWKWDGVKISAEPVELKPADAEELFGLRYAREALDLDPAYIPAQIAFLKMALERTVLEDFQTAILKPLPPATQRLLATVDADLLLRVLDRAYEENNVPLILGGIRILGDRGELRAAKPSAFGHPQGVVRGLYYPDRRVQFQAVNSLLKMPSDQSPAAASRTVEVLDRLSTAGEAPAALVVGASADKLGAEMDAVRNAGFAPIAAKTIQDALVKARSLGQVDAIILNYGANASEIPYAIAQLRADIDLGHTPVIVAAPDDLVTQATRAVGSTRTVKVLAESLLPAADELKKQINDVASRVGVAPLSADERKAIAARSLDILNQMARNQIPGYDVRPTVDNVSLALRSVDYAPIALEILGRVPGTVPQIRLAEFVLDPSRDALRVAAARELNRHAQHNGVLLPKKSLDHIRELYRDPATDVALRTELAHLIGGLPTTSSRDGRLLMEFRPDPPAAPAVAPEAPKKDE